MAASKRISSSAEMSLVATTHRPLPDFHTILTTPRQLKGYYSNIGNNCEQILQKDLVNGNSQQFSAKGKSDHLESSTVYL
jgi:hypothetical protein